MKEKKILYKKSPKAVTVYDKDGRLYVVGYHTTFQVNHHGEVLSEIDSKEVQVVNRFLWYYNN